MHISINKTKNKKLRVIQYNLHSDYKKYTNLDSECLKNLKLIFAKRISDLRQKSLYELHERYTETSSNNIHIMQLVESISDEIIENVINFKPKGFMRVLMIF